MTLPELLQGLDEGSYSIQIRSNRKRGKIWLDAISLSGNEQSATNPGAGGSSQLPTTDGGGAAPVPEPATMLLFGAGLMGFVVFRKIKTQQLGSLTQKASGKDKNDQVRNNTVQCITITGKVTVNMLPLPNSLSNFKLPPKVFTMLSIR